MRSLLVFLLDLFCINFCGNSCQQKENNAPLVQFPAASIIGSVATSHFKKRNIYSYRGIPFAKPPSGQLRFRAPIKAELKGTIDATEFKRRCPQIIQAADLLEIKNSSGDLEDCLYLNVFTPLEKVEKNGTLLPVIIYIHGGSFTQNSAKKYFPEYFMDEDVVLVTLQYRLSVFGFLCMDHPEVAGNMGFLDQLMAIEWVHNHIKYFGGDHGRVTLMGQSAGAASVSLMLVSPSVKPNLFHNVVIQSGTLLGDWLMDKNALKHSQEFAKFAKCPENNVEETIACLKSRNVADLLDASQKYTTMKIIENKGVVREFGIRHAVIQSSGGDLKFLTENPKDTFIRKEYRKVPVMTGITKHEGSFILGTFYDVYLKGLLRSQQFPNGQLEVEYLQNQLFYDLLHFLDLEEETAHLELIKDYYLPDEKCVSFISMAPGLVDLCSVLIFKLHALEFARHTSQNVPTYLYSFDYKGRHSKIGYGLPVNYPFSEGVAHSDELIYLFPHGNQKPTVEEESVIRTMIQFWTSFATNGKPRAHGAPEWLEMNTKTGPYMKINRESQLAKNFLKEYKTST